MLDFLRADGSIVVNKKLCHAIGLHEAILYSELVSKHFYFAEKGQLDTEGFFFNVADNLLADTSLSYKQQKLALDNLSKLNLIMIKIKGVPARKYFKINQDLSLLGKLMVEGRQNQQFGKKVKTRSAETYKQDVQKQLSNNTNLIIQNNNNKDYIILTQNDGRFISFYLSVYSEYFKDKHPTITNENYYKLQSIIEEISEYYEYEDWCDAVVEHFENLTETNNGSIISFIYSCARYFNINPYLIS